MQALHRSGRRDEALNVYHQLRHVLDEELGLEPSPEAQEIQHEILQVGAIPGPTPHRAIGTKILD
jgi:DNA-binding SARP family transcriptional activator